MDYAQSAFFGRRPPQHIADGRNWRSSRGRWNAPLGGQPGVATLGDLLGQEDPQVEHMLGMLALAAHWGELPRREQEIMLMRLHGDMTQEQIGQRLRISQIHVFRLLAGRSATSARACPACRSTHPAPVSPGHAAWI